MAKKSLVERDRKRKFLFERFLNKRENLKVNIQSVESFQQKMEYQSVLQKLPRNSSLCRQRNRCFITGRPRGYYRFFGLSRHVLRDMAHYGLLPGVTKSSW